jgi:hypothetical protein
MPTSDVSNDKTPAIQGRNNGSAPNDNGPGIFGESLNWDGVTGHGINHTGVAGISDQFVGVWGESHSPDQPGIFGKGVKAGGFDGNVDVSGNLAVNGVVGLQKDLNVNGNIATLVDVQIVHVASLKDIAARIQILEKTVASDVQGIAESLVTLAARVTALGG